MGKRGSGTLQDRVGRMSGRMPEESVNTAKELASSNQVDILKLAYYICALAKESQEAAATDPATENAEV